MSEIFPDRGIVTIGPNTQSEFHLMSDREPTRWHLSLSHKSLRVHLRFDLPFANFHIDYDLEIILTVDKFM